METTRSKFVKPLIVTAVFILTAFLFGCQSSSESGEGGGGGDVIQTVTVEGTLPVEGDGESGDVSFAFGIPAGSAALTSKEIKGATGVLLVKGTIGNFKIDLEGTYDTATGEFDLAAEGTLLGTTISVALRGRLDAARNFTASSASITTATAAGVVKTVVGGNAQKPAAGGSVEQAIAGEAVDSPAKMSAAVNGVLPQFLGTWWGDRPSFTSDPEGEALNKIVVNVNSAYFTYWYTNTDRSESDSRVSVPMRWIGPMRINSDDGTQQQYYVVEFPPFSFGEEQTEAVFMNMRAKDKVSGRQMNIYLDNGPNAGTDDNFPANVYSSVEAAQTDEARTKQRDAIAFKPLNLP